MAAGTRKSGVSSGFPAALTQAGSGDLHACHQQRRRRDQRPAQSTGRISPTKSLKKEETVRRELGRCFGLPTYRYSLPTQELAIRKQFRDTVVARKEAPEGN